MSSYPIVLVPAELRRCRKSTPTVLEHYCFPKPNPPERKSKFSEAMLTGIGASIFLGFATCLFGIIPILLFSELVFSYQPGLQFFYVLGSAVGVSFYIFALIKSYREDRELDDYYREKRKEYESDLKRYRELEATLSDPEVIQQHRSREVLRAARQSADYIDYEQEMAQKGASESFFLRYLRDRLTGEVLENAGIVSHDGFSPGYVCDSLYIGKLGIKVDIEIDEPYSFKDREPIHYVGADRSRNRHFLENGWVVMRFSEEQIYKHPASCCDFIEQAVENISKAKSVGSDHLKQANLPTRGRWTKEEAALMENQKYRLQYAK